MNYNAKCAMCSKSFYRSPSKLKTKSGLVFCNRVCKEAAQSLSGGLSQVQPDHYGKGEGIWTYRSLAFSNLPNQCKICGWADILEVLEVNHIDCNRKNNDISNLEILCPTHHQVFHFQTKTGRWATKRAKQMFYH